MTDVYSQLNTKHIQILQIKFQKARNMPVSIQEESSRELELRNVLDQPITELRIQHWRKALIGKEFNDLDENVNKMRRW